MSNTIAPAYPLDVTGTAATNLITGEQQVLTPANGNDFHFIVPFCGPFFDGAKLVISVTSPAGVTRQLKQGIDYLVESFIFVLFSPANQPSFFLS